MTAPEAAELIDHARRSVRAALRQWKATDLKGIHECRSLLEQSVADLKTAIELLLKRDSPVSHEIPPMISMLRHDISSMIRLVDACSAFHRGMSLRRGGPAPSYDASGQTVGDPGALAPNGVVG